MALIGFACWWISGAYADKAQRDRFSAAALHTLPIRVAIEDQFKRIGTLPVDFAPFVKQPRYAVEHSKLGRIAFSVTVNGSRLVILFDSDQGPFAGKVLVYEAIETNGSINWTCSVQGIADRYVPGACHKS